MAERNSPGLDFDVLAREFRKQLTRQGDLRIDEKVEVYRACAEAGCLENYNTRWQEYRIENGIKRRENGIKFD